MYYLFFLHRYFMSKNIFLKNLFKQKKIVGSVLDENLKNVLLLFGKKNIYYEKNYFYYFFFN